MMLRGPKPTIRLTAPLLVLLLMACGVDDGNRSPAEETVDADTMTRDTVAVVDSLIQGPADDTAAAAPDQGRDDGSTGAPSGGSAGDSTPDEARGDGVAASPTGPDRAEPAPTEPDALTGRYLLASVEGESLPVVIGEGPECDLQLVHGDLAIREGLDFLLRATLHHVCAGERAGEDLHTAEGRVTREGSALRFEARYDSLFATAYGRRMDDGAIVINRLDTEGGPQEVEWRFLQ